MRAFDLAGWTDNHPDLVQCWACPRFVGIDGRRRERLPGGQLCHTPGIPGSKSIVRATVRRVNVRPTNSTLHVSLWRARARRGTSSTRSRFRRRPLRPRSPWAAGSDTSPYGTARVTAGSSCPAAAEPSKARATTPYAATTCGGRARRTTLPEGPFRASAWRRLRAAGPRRDGLPVPRIPLDPELGVTRPSDVERGIAPGGSFAEEPLQPRRCCGRFSLKRRKDRTWLAPQSGARSRSPH